MAKAQRRDQVNRRKARQMKEERAAAEVKPVRRVQVTFGRCRSPRPLTQWVAR